MAIIYQYGKARTGVIVFKLDLKLESSYFIKFYLQKHLFWGGNDQILLPTLWRRTNLFKPLLKITSFDSVLNNLKIYAKITKIKGKLSDYGLHSFHGGAFKKCRK